LDYEFNQINEISITNEKHIKFEFIGNHLFKNILQFNINNKIPVLTESFIIDNTIIT